MSRPGEGCGRGALQAGNCSDIWRNCSGEPCCFSYELIVILTACPISYYQYRILVITGGLLMKYQAPKQVGPPREINRIETKKTMDNCLSAHNMIPTMLNQ